jgi:hypothetical protein
VSIPSAGYLRSHAVQASQSPSAAPMPMRAAGVAERQCDDSSAPGGTAGGGARRRATSQVTPAATARATEFVPSRTRRAPAPPGWRPRRRSPRWRPPSGAPGDWRAKPVAARRPPAPRSRAPAGHGARSAASAAAYACTDSPRLVGMVSEMLVAGAPPSRPRGAQGPVVRPAAAQPRRREPESDNDRSGRGPWPPTDLTRLQSRAQGADLSHVSLVLQVSERARQDSNLRLLPPEGSALSTELRAPGDECRPTC